MQLTLEDLTYQQEAIDTAVHIFRGQCSTSHDRPQISAVNANICNLNNQQIQENKSEILKTNNLAEDKAFLSDERQVCIEMETGTGKTLVYLRTIHELHQKYGYTKFIILVPSIAIKEGIKSTLKAFQKPLESRYTKIKSFEYDSKSLTDLKHFIGDNNPQIMITTIQAFTAEERILNQKTRDDSIDGLSYLEALGETRPVIIMDEPQEGMDTELAQQRLATLNPLFIFRYSATHKRMINRLYRLTPAKAYDAGMVKRIEVLTVAEKNDEATLKIEVSNIQTKSGQDPKVKLMLWHNTASGMKFKESRWLKVKDNLANVTNNVSYQDYTIERINKGLRDSAWKVESNGITFIEKQKHGDIEGLFRIQLHWLIRTHFIKKTKLKAKGIKCLSLIFIDRVDNYMGDNPLIKRLFAEEYLKVNQEFNDSNPTAAEIEAIQGYYFAQTGKGDYTDNENSMKKNKTIFDLILKQKEKLLSFENEIEFIFSHSALGVGWDNPNIFNIATLNQSYSETKKRQELGRGLRICVNQEGKRVYDPESDNLDDEINLLTIIPNETYETFALQYQTQIKEELGDTSDGANLGKSKKGNADTTTLTRNEKLYESQVFKDFWKKLSQKTDFTVKFDEARIIDEGIKQLNAMIIPEYRAEVTSNRILNVESLEAENQGSEIEALNADFSAIDLIEVLSEETSLSYRVVLRIVNSLNNLDQLIKNPPLYVQEASTLLKRIELDEMYRATQYKTNGESFPHELDKIIDTALPVEPTPSKGIYDYAICDSNSTPEHNFARQADTATEVVSFLKLPKWYNIKTPIGTYTPDFGIIIHKKKLREQTSDNFYFVIESKSTNDLEDGTLKPDEYSRIRFAIKHFEAIGIENVRYVAPVKDYTEGFKKRIDNEQ